MMLILWRKVPLRGEQSRVGGKDLQHLRADAGDVEAWKGGYPSKEMILGLITRAFCLPIANSHGNHDAKPDSGQGPLQFHISLFGLCRQGKKHFEHFVVAMRYKWTAEKVKWPRLSLFKWIDKYYFMRNSVA